MLALLLLLISACGTESRSPEIAGPPRPNVVLMIVDTLRADVLGAYGNPTGATPNFDRFAQGGTLFENAFANSSWTRASVASILSGRYPPRHGAQRRMESLSPEVDLISEILSQHGYATAFVTTNPNVGSYFGFDQGFNAMRELFLRREVGMVKPKELITPSDEATRDGIAWLASAPRPFLLVLHTIDPHAPYDPPKDFDRYMPSYHGPIEPGAGFRFLKLKAADRERVRSLYYGEVAFSDDSFGALVTWLREHELFDDTLMVLTSDHGEEFFEYGPDLSGHGYSLTEVQIRVPLIVSFPRSDRVGKGARVSRPVQLVDVLPTILDLLELPPPESLDGRSLFAEAGPREATIYSSLLLNNRNLQAIVDFPWKLVWEVGSDRTWLFDLSRGSEAGGPPDLTPLRGRPEVRKRLLAQLRERLARAEAASPEPSLPQSEAPADVDEALRALGYVE